MEGNRTPDLSCVKVTPELTRPPVLYSFVQQIYFVKYKDHFFYLANEEYRRLRAPSTVTRNGTRFKG